MLSVQGRQCIAKQVEPLKQAAPLFSLKRVSPLWLALTLLLCLGSRGAEAWPTQFNALNTKAPAGFVQRANEPTPGKTEQEVRAAAIAQALQQRAAGDQDGALTTLERALTVMPHDVVLLKDIAIQALQMNQFKVADAAAREAYGLAPKDLDALYTLARIEAEEDFYPASRKHFLEYLQARPDDASAHYGLGHLLQRNEDTDGASAEFHRSIELQPLQTESYYQLGQIALDGNRNQEAETLFQQVLARAPTHGGALTGAGILAYRAHQYAQAAPLLEQAVASSPNYQPAHYYLGLVWNRLGQTQKSAQELSLAQHLAAEQQGKAKPMAPQY